MIAGRVKATDAKRDFFLYSRESTDNSLIYVRTLRCAVISLCDLSGPIRQVARGGCRLSPRYLVAKGRRWLCNMTLSGRHPQISLILGRVHLQWPKVILFVISKMRVLRKCFEAHPSITNLPWIGSRVLNNALRASIITPHSPKQKILVI